MPWLFKAAAVSVLTTVVSAYVQQRTPSALDDCRLVEASDLADKEAPTFASYRVAVEEPTANPKLDLNGNPIARRYRTVLRQEVANGPNFARHYRVAVWGCGSSCTMFAVVNLRSGRVITPEGFSATSGVYFDVDSQEAFRGSESDAWLLAFRKDSRLLVVLGDLDEDEGREGAFYFVLDKDRLRLIHSTLVRKNCDSAHP